MSFKLNKIRYRRYKKYINNNIYNIYSYSLILLLFSIQLLLLVNGQYIDDVTVEPGKAKYTGKNDPTNGPLLAQEENTMPEYNDYATNIHDDSSSDDNTIFTSTKTMMITQKTTKSK